MDLKLEEFKEEQAQLRDDFNGAINVVASDASEKVKLVENSLLAKITTLEGHVTTLVAEMRDLKAEYVALREENETLKLELRKALDELHLVKSIVAQGGVGGVANLQSLLPSSVDVPKPKTFDGSRSAKEIDNFLWSVEQHFNVVGVRDEQQKIDTAACYLVDTAMVWWRHRCGEISKGDLLNWHLGGVQEGIQVAIISHRCG